MLSPKAKTISAYIFNKLSGREPVEAIKMQKLMYYVNSWSLAFRDAPAFSDICEAWMHGPVYRDLYYLHRGQAVLPKDWNEKVNPEPDNALLTKEDLIIIDFVLDRYGDISGWDLRNLTHTETPWLNAWKKTKIAEDGKITNAPIDHEDMKSYYSKMILD